TFRQVVILTVAALIIYAAWTALARVVHPLAFLTGAIPLAGFAFVLAVGRRDGIPLDAWLLDAIRHRRAPHQLVPTDDAIGPAPAAFPHDPPAEPGPLHRPGTLAGQGRRGPGHTIRRAAEAVGAPAACEVTAAVLDAADTAATLAACLDPTAPPPVGVAPDSV